MDNFLNNSAVLGIVISLVGYEIGLVLKRKYKYAIFNPLFISIIFVVSILLIFDIDYEVYNNSAKYITFLLTPTTICLAVPIYERLSTLKENYIAILAGIMAGVLTSLASIFAMSWAFRLSYKEFATLLPKSITTAIGMELSRELGGYVTITIITIIVTGILGSMCASGVCKLFGITDPVSKGVAIGTSAHVVGTSRAIEMGEIEGAISSLSIVIAALFTLIWASLFSNLYTLII